MASLGKGNVNLQHYRFPEAGRQDQPYFTLRNSAASLVYTVREVEAAEGRMRRGG